MHLLWSLVLGSLIHSRRWLGSWEEALPISLAISWIGLTTVALPWKTPLLLLPLLLGFLWAGWSQRSSYQPLDRRIYLLCLLSLPWAPDPVSQGLLPLVAFWAMLRWTGDPRQSFWGALGLSLAGCFSPWPGLSQLLFGLLTYFLVRLWRFRHSLEALALAVVLVSFGTLSPANLTTALVALLVISPLGLGWNPQPWRIAFQGITVAALLYWASPQGLSLSLQELNFRAVSLLLAPWLLLGAFRRRDLLSLWLIAYALIDPGASLAIAGALGLWLGPLLENLPLRRPVSPAA